MVIMSTSSVTAHGGSYVMVLHISIVLTAEFKALGNPYRQEFVLPNFFLAIILEATNSLP